MAEVVGALRWYLEIDGIAEAIFREVTGLDSETEVIEHRVTGKGGNIVVHKIPGALKWSNIVLRRGITDDRKLHDWRQKIEEGQVEANRKNGSITLYAPDGSVVAKYSFVKGWPCKFTGPALDAAKNEIAIEQIEIAHEGLKREQ
ncbi:MAG: phage tail protein [Armatimonadota bacterium]